MKGPRLSAHRVGQLVAGRYELLSVLGSGGQSVIFRARDRRDGDEVAIKLLAATNDPDACERMFREAHAMSQLQQTSAVRVLHQVRTDDGTMGLVMELLHGEDLDTHLTRFAETGAHPDVAWIERTFAPIVSTLAVAHQWGIVHRDLKPENIFLVDPAYGGGVKLLDFGFAKLLRTRDITSADLVAGSPSYLAPETWRSGSRGIDQRVDVYSLGVVLFRTISGKLPFGGGTLYTLMQQVTSGPRPSLHALRPDLPRDIDDWVAQALAVQREDRFLHVRASWSALLACLRSAHA